MEAIETENAENAGAKAAFLLAPEKKWRREPVIKKLNGPTKLKRARSLGYKAKQGFVVARTRIKKGGRRRPTIRKARKPKSKGLFFTTTQNKQSMAEKRVNRKFMNLEVLNSYPVGQDGNYHYFEVILVDKNHPVIKADKSINWMVNQRRRVFRGLTSAGKKSRGLR
ncbi:MAG: 50S ribosomal protein L15e [Candidatus Aenigmarchaeota archaeon]|nr:50S ribosomal protein L15e [Candidatus Aenigmarchaeota archaeon]